MRVVIIVQARMGSTRLPGKVMKPVLGVPMLVRQLQRLARCKLSDAIVVATTTRPEDTPIVDLVASTADPHCYRGPEDDVLARYLGAAKACEADAVVRVTADCPLIDPEIVDLAISTYLRERSHIAYVTNGVIRTYPRGLDVEVFPIGALETAEAEAISASDREHVTPFIWRRPERFPRYDLTDDADNSHLRWTVDTLDDFLLITRIYEMLFPSNPTFGYQDALGLIRAHPELSVLNAHVQQKST